MFVQLLWLLAGNDVQQHRAAEAPAAPSTSEREQRKQQIDAVRQCCVLWLCC